MAKRPIYIPHHQSDLLVKTESVEFQWHAGMASTQRQKSVTDLHAAAQKNGLCQRPLEVSSKSLDAIGVQLSAFNLCSMTEKHRRPFTVESAYQSSKVFMDGGPYHDLFYASSVQAKKDMRLKTSGVLVGFQFFGVTWPLEPKTAFYDWLYLSTLHKNPALVAQLARFDAFTDIEFNPQKSINCQAYSVALYLALQSRGWLDEALASQAHFIAIVGNRPINNANENTLVQGRLL